MRYTTILSLALLILIANPLVAATYLVGAKATGDGSGSNTSNLMTLDAANAALRPGDTARLLDTQGRYTASIKPVRGGTSESNRIVYEAYSGHKPYIHMGVELTGWVRHSGTDGVDAIYKINRGVNSGSLLILGSLETQGNDAFLWNLANPNFSIDPAGGKVNRERSTCYDPGCIQYPGDHTASNGITYLRTFKSDNPNNYTITQTILKKYGIEIQGLDYITIRGITVRFVQHFTKINNADHIRLENNTFQYAFGYGGVSIFDSNYPVLINNKIAGVGILPGHTADALEMTRVQYALVKGNDISYFGHQGVSIVDNLYTIVTHNRIYDGRGKNIQIKGWNCRYNVFEYNVSIDSPNADSLALQHWADHAGIAIGSRENIIRFNQFWNNSTAITLTPIIDPSSGYIAHHSRVYHNIAYGSRPTRASERGGGFNVPHYNYSDVVVVNNIFSENFAGTKWGNRLPQGDPLPVQIGFASDSTMHTVAANFENNILWSSGDMSKAFHRMSVAQYQSAYPNYAKNNIAANPLFTHYSLSNPDWTLQSRSPAIDQGRFLTKTVGSYFGNTVKVEDSRFFMDGYGIVTGDKIKVGNHPLVTIASINYSTHVITHNGNITGSGGQGVSFDYKGSAPDIGLYEYDSNQEIFIHKPSEVNIIFY